MTWRTLQSLGEAPYYGSAPRKVAQCAVLLSLGKLSLLVNDAQQSGFWEGRQCEKSLLSK